MSIEIRAIIVINFFVKTELNFSFAGINASSALLQFYPVKYFDFAFS